MADSAYSVSIIEGLRRDIQLMKDLDKALQDLKARLDQEDISFALLGALSMAYHGYRRFTEDIDILTTAQGLEQIHQRLVGRGLVPRAAGLKKSLRHVAENVRIDVIQSGEHAGSESSPLIYPEPDSEAFMDHQGLRIPTLQTLVEIKLTSGMWGKRLRDQADVAELIKANKLDESFSSQLLPEIQERFFEILTMTREEVGEE